MDEIHAFLSAFKPRSICLGCLAAVTGRADTDVTTAVDTLVSTHQAGTGVCLNCAGCGLVVRLRAA